jgi:hypothetical protein
MNKMGLVPQGEGAPGAYEYGVVMLIELRWTGRGKRGLDWCHKCCGRCPYPKGITFARA